MLRRLKRLLTLAGKGREAQAVERPEALAARAAPVPRTEDGTPAIHRGPAVVHQPIPLSDLDPDAVRIIQRLTRFDHTAYLVGGCVRDLLLDRKPKDFDVGTTATPRQVKRLFRNSRIIGRRFRLAHVYYQSGKIIEVATFRARDEEPDAAAEGRGLLRRDDNVFGTPEEDALRRDFTINALFYDVGAGNVIDHAGGLQDLRRRLVRTIGDPETRFREDPIRILRAIKFAARLGFDIEPATYEALRSTRDLIPHAAAARVLEEIRRFCLGGAARRSFELMREGGVLDVVFPALAEACRDGRGGSGLLDALLEEMDRRVAQGSEPSLGEIFATLVLPVIAPRLGWAELPGGETPGGVNVPALVNDALRPVAQQLKLPRAEQERCRQILATLHRMAHPGRLRRSARHALRRRPSFGSARWMLEAAARILRGGLEDAVSYWRAEGRGPEAGGAESPAERIPPGPLVEEPRRRRGRSRRRGGRRGREAGGQAQAPEKRQSPPLPSRETVGRTRMPPAWDDDYFFAALPKVPPMLDEVAPEEPGEPPVAAETVPAEAPAAAPRRRRRRRRRSRKAAAPPGTSAAPAGEA